MKVKTIEWVDCGVGEDAGRRIMSSAESTPQILYTIRKIWNEDEGHPCYRIEFSHGYVPASLRRSYGEEVGKFPSIEESKVKAQEHFEKYIMESYLVGEPYVPPNPDIRPELR